MKLSIICIPIFAIAASAASTKKTCHVTGSDIEGPYYHPSAPKAKDMVCTDVVPAHDRIIVTGRVLDEDCHTPIQAELDIWHANHNGEYSSGKDGHFNCRSRITTDANGYYKFYSIMPGRYDDEGYRPAHIHFKITPANVEYKNITTQLYFQNDLYLDIDSCHHCHSNDPTLVVELTHLSDIKTFVGQWDVVMAKSDTEANANVVSEELPIEGPYTAQRDHIIAGPDDVDSLKSENSQLKKQLEEMRRLRMQEL